jgi:hypothetical protein
MNPNGQKTNKSAKRSPASHSTMSTAPERLPAMVETRWKMVKARWTALKVRRTLSGLKRDGVRLLKLHPLAGLVAAFAAGVAVTTLARRA